MERGRDTGRQRTFWWFRQVFCRIFGTSRSTVSVSHSVLRSMQFPLPSEIHESSRVQDRLHGDPIPISGCLATVSIEDISPENFLTNASEYFLDPCTQLPFLLAPIHLLITQGTHQRDENTYISRRNSSRQPPPPPNTNSDNSNGQHVNWNCDLNP